MLDLTLRLLARVLSCRTPRPRGRHRLGAVPPLRFVPLPPPRFADGRLQRERRRAAYLATLGIDVGPARIHGVRVASR
ncbi:hypothetical protein ACH4UV_16605 [Streptomyces sp. NPDC020802]|uniref:hypothetical protein n=1 Tax=Streptomyces sp. NPDC020802 TaxID=3365094 RepID=UPI00379D516A